MFQYNMVFLFMLHSVCAYAGFFSSQVSRLHFVYDPLQFSYIICCCHWKLYFIIKTSNSTNEFFSIFTMYQCQASGFAGFSHFSPHLLSVLSGYRFYSLSFILRFSTNIVFYRIYLFSSSTTTSSSASFVVGFVSEVNPYRLDFHYSSQCQLYLLAC